MAVAASSSSWSWKWCWWWLFWLFNLLQVSVRRIMIWIISAGAIPNHVAIIMDGNRRFAQRRRIERKNGHEFGAQSLMETLKDCYELGVKCVTVYAFSIENFKRSNEEVAVLMDLMQHKLEALLDKENLVNQFGIRVRLLGNLELLPDGVRRTAEKVMVRTVHNDRAVLNVCVAYTSTEEIVQAVRGACRELLGFRSGNNGELCVLGFNELTNNNRSKMLVSVEDIERHLYTAGCPEPGLLIRTSGETRLSNFLLWQSGFCYLHACGVLWPEFSFRNLFMAVLAYQRAYAYVKQRRRDLKEL